MKLLSYPRSLSLVCLIGTLGFMTGCSSTMSMPDISEQSSDFGVVHGGIYGGQQPVTGAQVYLYQTTSGGSYGNMQPTSLLGTGTGVTLTCPSSAPANNKQATALFPLVYVSPGICYYQTGGYNGTVVTGKNEVNYGYGTGNGTKNSLNDGEFNLTGLYKCTPGAQVWLYSINGFPDSVAADQNPYASLMADLGQCPANGNFYTAPNAITFIYVNELSTVAMAYSVAGFTADPTSISTSGTNTKISGPSTNTVGLANAFANAQQLYNIFGLTDQPDLSAPHTTTYGVRNGVPPFTLINTIGDALASCINSTGNLAGPSSNCTNLYTDVYGSGSLTANDTTSVAFHIAKHPNGPNPTALLSLVASNPVWQPYYNTGNAPPDLSVAINYSGGGTPQGMILDPGGNAYVDNYATNGDTAQLTPLGVVTITPNTSSVNKGSSLAIDTTGLIWTPSSTTGAIYKVANTTALTTVTIAEPAGTLTAAGYPYPDPVAGDGHGNVYFADYAIGGGEIYSTNASGSTSTLTQTSGVLTGTGCINGADGVAVDTSGALWVAGAPTNPTSAPSSILCRISSDATTLYAQAPSTCTGTHCPSSGLITEADGVAVGLNNSAWTYYSAGSDLFNVTTGASVTGPFSGGGMSKPVGVAVDGSGNVWTINYISAGGSISEFNGTSTGMFGAPISGSNPGGYGFQNGSLLQPSGIGIDISGNLWTSNFGDGSVTEVIGIATPTAALLTNSTPTPATKP